MSRGRFRAYVITAMYPYADDRKQPVSPTFLLRRMVMRQVRSARRRGTATVPTGEANHQPAS
jgi:hypothetical protein